QFPKHTKVTRGSVEDYQQSYDDKYAFAYVNGIPRGKFYVTFIILYNHGVKHEISFENTELSNFLKLQINTAEFDFRKSLALS
ncbi:1660_t:CDS:2, partial [Gigaspora margarita]